MKKSFALLVTIMLVTLFAILSVSIVETHNFATNIDTLKYLHLQANIHLDYIKKYIKTHTKAQISTFSLNDLRFNAKLNLTTENNQSKYHIYIETKDLSPIRVYSSIIKN